MLILCFDYEQPIRLVDFVQNIDFMYQFLKAPKLMEHK